MPLAEEVCDFLKLDGLYATDPTLKADTLTGFKWWGLFPETSLYQVGRTLCALPFRVVNVGSKSILGSVMHSSPSSHIVRRGTGLVSSFFPSGRAGGLDHRQPGLRSVNPLEPTKSAGR